MDEPSIIEKITGNMATKGGLTLLAATTGIPLAALLPVLSDTIAASRHNKRVEEALKHIENILLSHRHRLDALTDPQYKLMNEIVLAVLQNTENEKVEYLQRAIVNGLDKNEISHTAASQVSRALRDLTAGEMSFINNYYGSTILIGPVTVNNNDQVAVIDRQSEEMIYVTGLIGLGVIYPAGSTLDDAGRYVFSIFVKDIKELIS